MAAVPLNQTARPDAYALEALDRFARGEAGLSDTRAAIEVCLAAGDWRGHEMARRRLERVLEAPAEELTALAQRWRETYGIAAPSA